MKEWIYLPIETKNRELHSRILLALNAVLENFNVVYDLIEKVKPSKAKGIYMKSLTLCSVMSPGIKIEPMRLRWEGN